MTFAHLILDGGGVEHGHVIHGDALPDDPLAAPLQLLLAVAVGQVQQTDRVLGGQVHLARNRVIGELYQVNRCKSVQE